MLVFLHVGAPIPWLVHKQKLHVCVGHGDCVKEGCSAQATDSTFGAKLRENLHSNGRFKFDPKKPTDDIIVQHYAGPVTYSCTKFLDKNKDTLSPGKLSYHVAHPSFCFGSVCHTVKVAVVHMCLS